MFSYIHIPFCESKCKYCRFASLGSVNKILVKTYLAQLIKDIQNFKRPDGNNSGFLNSIYFGGGTPSILEEKDLELIIGNLEDKFGFEHDIEITLETTPKNITYENILSWEKFKINRISVGVQTLNDKTLSEINRDSSEVILNGLELLKTSKIDNISVDFIIGLPHVKSGEILKDIKIILNNYDFIKHISVYMLEDYYIGNTDDSSFENITYPKNWENLGLKEEEYLKEYLEIKNYLHSIGFERYELSNFAKAGYECLHNKSYWEHSEVIGFGLGSHSFIGGKRYAYKDDFLSYYKGKLEYSDDLIENDIFIEKVMFGLRTLGLKREIYEKLNQNKIKEFINEGFLEIKNEYLVITDKAISLIDKIILELI